MSTTTQNKVNGAIAMYIKPYVLNFRDEKPTLYKLQMMRCGVITNKNIIAYAAQAAHVPESTVTLAQSALFDAINYFCMNGHTVQMPGMGSFGIRLNSKTVKVKEDANADSITRKYIRFYPKTSLRNMCSLKNISIEIQDIFGLKPKNNNSNSPEQP